MRHTYLRYLVFGPESFTSHVTFRAHTQTHLTDRTTWTTKFGRQTFVSDSEARCLSMLRDSAVSERDGFDIYLDKDRLTVKSVAVSI